MSPPASPPEYDAEPPAHGVCKRKLAVAVCHDCETVVGPTNSEDVGYDLWHDHETHDTEVIAQWTAVEILPEHFFDQEAAP